MKTIFLAASTLPARESDSPNNVLNNKYTYSDIVTCLAYAIRLYKYKINKKKTEVVVSTKIIVYKI